MPVSHKIGALITAILCIVILLFCIVRFILDAKEAKKLRQTEQKDDRTA